MTEEKKATKTTTKKTTAKKGTPVDSLEKRLNNIIH